jgi:predicted Zn-ribbon and HTH transcriptional regulator
MTPLNGTVRERLGRILHEGPANARDLSRRAGVRERDVPGHLEHLARTLARAGERLVVDPPTCLECGFVFRKRERLTRPGRCPRCQSTRTSLPVFSIEAQ